MKPMAARQGSEPHQTCRQPGRDPGPGGRPPRRAAFSLPCLLTLAIALCGCLHRRAPAPSPYRVSRAPWYMPAAYPRVVVLPVDGLEDDPVAAAIVTDALLAELQDVGPFELVPPEPIEFARGVPHPSPALPVPDQLADLAARHRADAVLFTTVTSYEPYSPMRLGLSVRLVSVQDGATLVGIDTVRIASIDVPPDSAACSGFGPHDDIWHAEAALAGCSPRYFARYVAHQVAEALAVEAVLPPATGSGWSILPGFGPRRESCAR